MSSFNKLILLYETTLTRTDRATAKEAARIIRDSIRGTAMRDVKSSSSIKTSMEDGRKVVSTIDKAKIPDSRTFYNSFFYRTLLRKDGVRVKIYTRHPAMESYIEGRDQFVMDWSEGRIPMKGGIRTSKGKWVHPGFPKMDFVRRGIEAVQDELETLLTFKLGML